MSYKKYNKVAVGGTFDKFHEGHKKLLNTAFEIADFVEIGVTSDAFGGLKGNIDSCKIRIDNIKSFFSHKTNFIVIPLDDSYGTTIYDADFEAIVVSKETEPTAIEINEIRSSKSMDMLDIIVVNFVLAYDGNPISSTRIRSGEINNHGDLLK